MINVSLHMKTVKTVYFTKNNSEILYRDYSQTSAFFYKIVRNIISLYIIFILLFPTTLKYLAHV